MDFACGITPGTPPGDRLPKPVEVVIDGRIHQGFEMTRRKLSGLTFRLESSFSLTDWKPDPRVTVEVLRSVDDTSERIRLLSPDPAGAHRKQFFRLRVDD